MTKRTRREFISACGAFTIAGASAERATRTKRIACIGTEYRPNSHVDVILTKFLEGCTVEKPAGGATETFEPKVKVASLYLDQFPANDLGRAMAKKHEVPVFDTIEGALTLGTGKLAVDGVLCIGEHGTYPHNEKGQHMYPRRRFFEEVVKVFEHSERVVPVFNDKHLSYSWESAKWMYDKASELKVPFMAGSSIPVSWRKPPLEIPLNAEFEEALVVGYGGLESYGFHTLEGLQCMIERRKGGERGVKSVQLLHGDAVWGAGDGGRWSWDLLQAALSRRERMKTDEPRRNVKEPYAFVIEFRDGLKANALMLNGVTSEFLFAAKLKGQSEPVSTLFWLQEGPPFGHFYKLDIAIQQMILTGKPTYPVERTLLTTGILAAAMESQFQQNRRIQTPELDVHYTVKR